MEENKKCCGKCSEKNDNTKLYLVIIFLVFIYPVGVILMWIWMKLWPKWLKFLLSINMILILTVILGFIIAFIIAVTNSGNKVNKSGLTQQYIQQTVTPILNSSNK